MVKFTIVRPVRSPARASSASAASAPVMQTSASGLAAMASAAVAAVFAPSTARGVRFQMEADGLVKRTAYSEIPPRVEYSLTPLGESLNEALVPLGDWGEDHMALIAERRSGRASTAAQRRAR